jgi:hypothetical protein
MFWGYNQRNTFKFTSHNFFIIIRLEWIYILEIYELIPKKENNFQTKEVIDTSYELSLKT